MAAIDEVASDEEDTAPLGAAANVNEGTATNEVPPMVFEPKGVGLKETLHLQDL